ncbi:tRNA-uridine aminocarboxypropyltransferase [Pokkaliibacter plantistimulans]|nr:DTW domain-containing protein [Pokkaliibacter plantistimulans]
MPTTLSIMLKYHPAASVPADVPRKPFNARGANVRRCQACQLPEQGCICAYKATAAADCEFWLIMHHDELFKPSNTGRLIADVLPTTEVFEWSRIDPPAALLERLADERYQPYLVFPADEPEDQARLLPFQRQTGKTPVFILLDGTWRQARRMFRHSKWLQSLPLISFTPERSSGYGLREAAEESHLCTAEVGVELLKLAGEPAAEVLAHYFYVFNVHYLAGRRGTHQDDAEASRQWLLAQQA